MNDDRDPHNDSLIHHLDAPHAKSVIVSKNVRVKNVIKQYLADKSHRYWTMGTSFVSVLVILSGFACYAYFTNNETGPVVAAGPAVTAAPAPDPDFRLSPDSPCFGRTATTTDLPDIEICVAYWCTAPLMAADGTRSRDRGQVKLRPRIINNSPDAFDISSTNPSPLRLLISTPLPYESWWQPPPNTVNHGDKPYIIKTPGGQKYWAIPPNVNKDAVPITLPDGSGWYDGFSGSWPYTILESGQTAFKPLRHEDNGAPIQEGNLVFNVPMGDVGIKGFAIVDPDDPTRVVALADRSSWPASSDLNSF